MKSEDVFQNENARLCSAWVGKHAYVRGVDFNNEEGFDTLKFAFHATLNLQW